MLFARRNSTHQHASVLPENRFATPPRRNTLKQTTCLQHLQIWNNRIVYKTPEAFKKKPARPPSKMQSTRNPLAQYIYARVGGRQGGPANAAVESQRPLSQNVLWVRAAIESERHWNLNDLRVWTASEFERPSSPNGLGLSHIIKTYNEKICRCNTY